MAAPTAQPALAPGLARKVKKIMDTRTEAPEVVGSLATLSGFYADNSPAARRRLRSTIEHQGVAVNEEFLAAAQTVLQALDAVQADLDALSSCCEAMGGSLAGSRAAAADLLHDTDRLTRALQTSETRSQLVGRFLEQYQLTPAEATALQSEEVGPAFFAALAHVRQIHANCKALLRTHHQRAGLELMDTMGSLQEAAYERLCRWVQAECRGLSEADAPEVNPLLQQAAAALRERPVLFRYCAEEVAQARHTALFQRFIKALTRGPRPIEMHAHDPRRYVSDMLAWVHASLASEQELLVSLFGDDSQQAALERQGSAAGAAGGAAAAAAAQQAEGTAAAGSPDGAPTIPQLLDSVFESICRPLRVRIEQVLMSSPPPLLCFRLSQLLAFYLGTVEGLLGAGSQLAEALRASRAMALRTFQETLRQRGDKLLRYPPPPPRDLAPPQQLVEGAQLLADLISSYEQSLDQQTAAQQGAGGSGGDADFSAVLSAVADPLAEMCSRSSEALNPAAASRVDEGSHLDPTDQRVFMVNCLFTLASPLAGHECALAQAQRLHDALESHVAAVVGAEVSRTLAKCGLAEVVARLQQVQEQGSTAGQPLAAEPALELGRVAGAMRTFFARLSDPAMLPELPKLQVPRLKAEAIQRVLQALADAYATVHAALNDPASGYPAAEVAEAVRHTPAQVRTLLGVV